MKILKLLNKKYLPIIFLLIISSNLNADDKPVDIWNVDKDQKIENSGENSNMNKIGKETESKTNLSIYEMQTQKDLDTIKLEDNSNNKKIRIIGLYDPQNFGLDINMWTNSNGDQLRNIFSKLNNIKLSKDAIDIMNISMLVNAHVPSKNISEKEFMKIRADWLIKNSDFELLEEYLIQNQALNIHPELTKYLVNFYLAEANVEKSCEIF